MSDTPVLRSRRSRSGTPLAPVRLNQTPIRNGFLHGGGDDKTVTRITPAINDSVLEVDASFRTEDKVSPMLAKLRMTPAINDGVLEVDASFQTEEKVSPMLAKLCMTPGRLLKEKQTLLVRKHEASKKKLDSINVGGGVSLWPDMDSMRLTRRDVWRLSGTCLLLAVIVTAIFYILHGPALSELLRFHKVLMRFSKKHPIDISRGQEDFDVSVVQWHKQFRELVDSIHMTFDVNRLPSSYLCYMLVYAGTIAVLFYYLIDNMLAKSKLSPNRIKRWVCLLILTGTWTFLMTLTLGIALRTEAAVEMNIHALADEMADAIPSSLSCDKLSTVLQYWRIRCLPPTTHGTVTVFGLVPVRDLLYYLQYYSLPVGTILLTPVFKLVVSAMTVYNIGRAPD